MDANLWNLYLKLQTSTAYPGDLGAPNYGIINYTLDYVKRMREIHSFRNSLLIGPGGKDEVLAFRNTIEGSISILTAHLPEVERINQQGFNVVVSLGDMHDTPYETRAFDFLYASNVLEHAFAPYIALLELRRVLSDGGIAVFVLPSFEGPEGGRGPFHLHCLTQEVWVELLRKTGFVITDVLRQDGPQGYYLHFLCVACPPPVPHEGMLRDLITHKAGPR